MRRWCFDVDGTLCTQRLDGHYERAEPLWGMIEQVQRLRDAHIIIHTARGTMTGQDWRRVTEQQLRRWGVPFDELVMGKPYADVYVDDRAMPAYRFAQR